MTSGSSVSRVFSASAASWLRISVTVITQISLVPLYLRFWDVTTYGAWLLLQATWAIISIVDLAHHDYVGFECLRLGPNQHALIARVISSATPVAVLIALWDVFLVWQLGHSDFISRWIGVDAILRHQWNQALLLQAVTWLLTGSLGGLVVRWLTPFGYWPLFAWWGVFYSIVLSVFPALAVLFGADLLGTMWSLCLVNLLYHLIFFIVIGRTVKRRGFTLSRPILRQGFTQAFHLPWIVAKSLAEMVRQQGTRIILTPLAGVADMAAFTTMRTGANFALQGLSTISGPIMPEQIRFLAERDQARTEGTFAVVWFVLCVFLCPVSIIIQWLASSFFLLWTHGKIIFDPWLFGMLSLSVLMLALAQPASGVIQGNNILRAQLVISILSAIVVLSGIALLVPLMGIRGAALSLLAGEMISLLANVWAAEKWLRKHGMHWPWKSFGAAIISVLIAAIGMVTLELSPIEFKYISFGLLLVLQFIISVIFWNFLPNLVRTRIISLISRYI